MWRLSDPVILAALAQSRHRSRSGPLTVRWLEVPGSSLAEPPRVAYAIGKPVGGAVVRNRLRRRLRAIVPLLSPPPGAYLIGARPEATALTSSELGQHLRSAFAALPSTSARRP